MLKEIANGVMPIVVQAIITILGVLISVLVNAAVSYLNSKKQQLINTIGVEKYNANYEIAKSIFYMVEQQFKGQANVADEKRKMYDELILKRIPYLTQDEIDNFRESIVGKINSELKNSGLIDPAKSTQAALESGGKKG